MSESTVQRVLGIDLGIASCGWGVIEIGEAGGSIIAAGVRCFDAPLIDKTGEPKTGEPKSATRRTARGQRRIVRRRRQRMNVIRSLLFEYGVLTDRSPDALRHALCRISPNAAGSQATPWTLRAAAHERVLTNDELAVVLGHIARHRGFRSNSKNETGTNAADETSKMKKAIEATREGLAKYHSFGDMIANDPKFADRKREVISLPREIGREATANPGSSGLEELPAYHGEIGREATASAAAGRRSSNANSFGLTLAPRQYAAYLGGILPPPMRFRCPCR